MIAIVSITNDDLYRFFIPLINWSWNKLGVRVICFYRMMSENDDKFELIGKTNGIVNKMFPDVLRTIMFMPFYCEDQKEATYSQVSRIFSGALGIDDNETIVVSDADMMVLRKDFINEPTPGLFDVYGTDLVPVGQLPMCYTVANKKTWTQYFSKGRSYQECLDDELGKENCEHMRGNLWARDQELLSRYIGDKYIPHNRARPGTQFASKRYDRDDAYLLERLNPDTIDFHMPRPGYEDANFDIILKVLQYHYPYENFNWLIWYKEQYKQLL